MADFKTKFTICIFYNFYLMFPDTGTTYDYFIDGKDIIRGVSHDGQAKDEGVSKDGESFMAIIK